MKKLLSLSVASLALVAAAEYTASPLIGVTEITTTNKNTIVAVPFNSLAGAGNISVTDLVCTNGLSTGTSIYVFKDNGYKAWLLQGSGWEAATTVGEGAPYVAPGSGDEVVASPGAIWVVLTQAPTTPQHIYIYGQYTNATESAVAANASNLIANPLQSAATFALDGTPAIGDMIIIPNDGTPESYTYAKMRGSQDGVWTRSGSAPVASLSMSIQVGQGFWYVAKGSSVTKVTWSASAP